LRHALCDTKPANVSGHLSAGVHTRRRTFRGFLNHGQWSYDCFPLDVTAALAVRTIKCPPRGIQA
jgi:hypothetical protein